MGCAVGLGFQVAGVGMAFIILVILRSTQVMEKAAGLRSNQ
jgi:uncharacterized membrane protein YhiD involved in acid resistance